MKLVRNQGTDRVVDILAKDMPTSRSLDLVSPAFSLPGFATLRSHLESLEACRMVLPEPVDGSRSLLGSEADRSLRNTLTMRNLAAACLGWIGGRVTFRSSPFPVPQSAWVLRSQDGSPLRVVNGDCSFATDGLVLSPGNCLGLVQATETAEEAAMLASWFDNLWSALPVTQDDKSHLLRHLEEIAAHQAASDVYHVILHHLFKDLGSDLDEERIIKSATGIRNTVTWKKLYRFQRDGVVGAIDKLERFGGCIIADSVGTGKTFEALAIIKYYELRNDRVLVLTPKRLRDNWTLYASNDRRNILAPDRFNYDVLNHTDLSRDGGRSGDIDLSHVNWGNYDLVVIDESHNFRNKKSPKQGGETRYDKLMRRIIREGVKTRVLMLSATPVNNRLADLRNQIAFITEGKDDALADHRIPSIETTTRLAQTQFNRWLVLEDVQRTPARLMDMLGFDYFKLLDLLTIARSRKHIEKYYGTAETGRFPERLRPENIKADVDARRLFPTIREINTEIGKLTLGCYAPLRYVMPHKQEDYDKLYSVRLQGEKGLFRQIDREASLIHLMRVNLLKRMESSVHSFGLTLQRQLADVTAQIAKIDAHADSIEEIRIEDIDMDDPNYEPLLAGRKIKVLLKDCDLIRWRQDLVEDRNRLATLLSAASEISPARDKKLALLRERIAAKIRQPVNPGNRKIIVFTAFADTAQYLYRELAPWAATELGMHSALVTGSGANKTTLPTIRTDLAGILTAFSPRAKERAAEFADEGEIDLLIATDCISEGQNLQDCDFLVNFDIHWNPVRIIQRFGRIDRIGSTNASIQLVNFWPNIELGEYIDLEKRVGGRMVLLDVSATGEENIIETQPGDPMNDLEYRKKQLLRLQDAVIDLEDLSSGISIADLTLNDYRIDLATALREKAAVLERLPFGTLAVVTAQADEQAAAPGVVFCLRAVGEAALRGVESGYPLAPHFLVHIGTDGSVLLPHTQVKNVLDMLRRLSLGRDLPDAAACARFDKTTRQGEEMGHYRSLLAEAVACVVGKSTERAIDSLFSPGGTHALPGEFHGVDDFEVVAFIAILPPA